jgi:acyl-CoA synthetase (AMP-forming)/AMP-acid ligase II
MDDQYLALGEQVVAVLAFTTGAATDIETVLAYARSRLAGYMLPKSVKVVTSEPRTSVGKADHVAARALNAGPRRP